MSNQDLTPIRKLSKKGTDASSSESSSEDVSVPFLAALVQERRSFKGHLDFAVFPLRAFFYFRDRPLIRVFSLIWLFVFASSSWVLARVFVDEWIGREGSQVGQ